MVKAYLGLGSNLGEKMEHIKHAIDLLNSHEKIQVVTQAGLFRSEPVGNVEQDWFINTVVAVETELDPRELLLAVNQVEAALGRKRLIHWGPRTIDIDILSYGDLTVAEPDLVIPHKEIRNRAFVLVPLLELVEDLELGNGFTAKKALAKLVEAEGQGSVLGIKGVELNNDD